MDIGLSCGIAQIKLLPAIDTRHGSVIANDIGQAMRQIWQSSFHRPPPYLVYSCLEENENGP